MISRRLLRALLAGLAALFALVGAMTLWDYGWVPWLAGWAMLAAGVLAMYLDETRGDE